jgi:predicted phage terminase large subunit-like protein
MNKALSILAELRRRQEQEKIRTSYSKYVEYVHEGRWYPGKHLLFINQEIDKILNDTFEYDILIIALPPQHGKSQDITETLPSCYLGRHPDRRVIEVSYGDDLARRFGRSNKRKIEQFGKSIFNIELSRDSRSDTEFSIEGHQGSMISRGIMAGITGQPGDLIIIDDPIKNRQEADSETYRERMWEEWLNSINTRRSANCKVIIIQTRWHEDDLAGRLINTMPSKCKVINLPCEAEDNDILGRNKGDALFPEIGKDNTWLQEFKQAYATQEGARAWLALFQGRPTAQEGNLIKRGWFKYYKVMPDRFDQVIQSWDCTFKDSDGSDYVVGTVWGRVGADKYLLDIKRDRMDLPATIQAIIQMTAKWPDAWMKLVEDKANGSAVIQMLQHKIPGLYAVNPEGSKIARVQAVLPHIEAGNVYLPEDAEWVNDFVEECASFPQGKHDDQVDSMSQALIRLIQDYSTYKETVKKSNIFSFNQKEQGSGFMTW